MFNTLIFLAFLCREQPPPRGCVLKQLFASGVKSLLKAAASARLCVETPHVQFKYDRSLQPPPRGCVLKQFTMRSDIGVLLAAASARLCVETKTFRNVICDKKRQPPPRGCVLKH